MIVKKAKKRHCRREAPFITAESLPQEHAPKRTKYNVAARYKTIKAKNVPYYQPVCA